MPRSGRGTPLKASPDTSWIRQDLPKAAHFSSRRKTFGDKMSSGVTVDDEVMRLFMDMKKHRKQKVAFFRLSDDKKKIVVDQGKQVMWDDADPFSSFTKLLPQEDCRYALYDVSYDTDNAKNKEQLIFISWAPDTASIGKKMLHSTSQKSIQKAFGLTTEWQLNDLSDAGLDGLADKLSRDTVVRIEGRSVASK
ncbi:cofilin-2-like [Stigmatopora nigra]